MTLPCPNPENERSHEAGEGEWWQESYYFDFASDDGSLGGYVRIGLLPNQNRVWYWACLVEEDKPLVSVVDHGVPMPSKPGSLELRHDGLWADHNCETPLEHWSLGLEAFGVSVDDPSEMYRGARGERIPLGFDLEWETAAAPYRWPDPIDRYEVPCNVYGVIQRADDEIQFSGTGQRDHSWGERDWWQFEWVWSAVAFSDGARAHATVVRIGDSDFATGYFQDGSNQTVIDAFTVESRRTHQDLVEDIDCTLGDWVGTVDPVAWAPVLLESNDGRVGYFARALSRWTGEGADGKKQSGSGWIEFNLL